VVRAVKARARVAKARAASGAVGTAW
jgi:hypothetical protein